MRKYIVWSIAIAFIFCGVITYAMIGRASSTEVPQVVKSFEGCARAGYTVAESSPRHCWTPDGKRFVEKTRYPGWTTVITRDTGTWFQHPEKIGTAYISLVDWPPRLGFIDQPFSCKEDGGDGENGDGRKKKVLNGHTYCVTEISEGEAESAYIQYIYAFSHDEKTATLTFSLHFPECDDYDPMQKTSCKKERGSFDLDALMSRVAESLAPIGG